VDVRNVSIPCRRQLREQGTTCLTNRQAKNIALYRVNV